MKPESEARRGRKRRPKAMDLRTLSRVLTTAITRLEDDLVAASDPDETRRIAHALATVTGSYTRLLEASALEERVAMLERAQETLAEVFGMRRAA